MSHAIKNKPEARINPRLGISSLQDQHKKEKDVENSIVGSPHTGTSTALTSRTAAHPN
jgi:hypothetical protein